MRWLDMENDNTEIVDERKAISVTDLIKMANEAASKMSTGNQNKWILLNLGYALKQLVDRLEKYENPKGVM